jgi:hypothetical protein
MQIYFKSFMIIEGSMMILGAFTESSHGMIRQLTVTIYFYLPNANFNFVYILC